MPFFEHSFIDLDLPGRLYGQTALADLDGDGLPEFITGRQYGEIYWYDYKNGSWERHLLGLNSPSDVGGCVLDVDGDGWLDFVTGGAWYRNPGLGQYGPWERHVFDPSLTGVHDVVAADIDGDGNFEVITMSDKNDLRWYKITSNPRELWIASYIGPSVHAGVAVGDIDGDGDLDILRSDVWFENVKGDGTQWVQHSIGHFGGEQGWQANATLGWIADINNDGNADLVITDAEITGAKIYWMENVKGNGSEWVRHQLPHSDDTLRGAYHSLFVGDLDGDGDYDVFSCEMEAVPGERSPRFFIWENVDGKGGEWREHVILDANLGGHEAVVGDVNGDDLPDICSKLWYPREDNAIGGKMHVDFLLNRGNGWE